MYQLVTFSTFGRTKKVVGNPSVTYWPSELVSHTPSSQNWFSYVQVTTIITWLPDHTHYSLGNSTAIKVCITLSSSQFEMNLAFSYFIPFFLFVLNPVIDPRSSMRGSVEVRIGLRLRNMTLENRCTKCLNTFVFVVFIEGDDRISSVA